MNFSLEIIKIYLIEFIDLDLALRVTEISV